METYSLLWNHRLWSVTLPIDLHDATDRIRWTYVQTFVTTGGSHGLAMRRCLQMQYPGLGYDLELQPPRSVVVVRDGSSPGGAGEPSVCGTSSQDSCGRNYSQRPKPPSSSPAAKDGVSDTAGPRRPAPQSGIATSSSPRGPSARGPGPGPGPQKWSQQSNGRAMSNTGGWLGSKPTSA